MIQKLSSALLGLLVIGSMVGCGGDSGSNTQETLSSSQPMITVQEKINPDFLEWQKQQENNKLNKSDSNPLSTNGYIPPLHKPTVHNPKNDKQVVIRKVYDSSVSTSDSKFDYRDPNLDGNFSDSRLTPIKDQSNCGACWAFASYGALEGSLLQDENSSNDFSENNIKNGHGFLVDSCQGGNLDIASAYFARGNGPVFESEDEYNPNSTSSDYLSKPSARYVDNIIYLPVRSSTTDNEYLKQALLDHGPIYADINGDESNVYGNTIYNSEATGSNHSIVLVGWDDNYETEGQTGAFIIRNSWGTAYGENGYFYVPYSDQTLAFQEVGYFDDIKDNEAFNFDVIHDTAPNGAIVSYTIDSNTAPLYGMSVYNVEANQSIQAVGIFNNGEDTNITISFYKDVSFNESIFINTETLSEQFENIKKGWNTLQLQTPIDINTTYDKFAVKIQIQENGDNNATLPVDASYAGWTKLTTEVNQSFISANGTEWVDLHNYNQSVAIKVFAQSIDINGSEDNTSNELLSLIWENIATGIEANLTAEQYNNIDGVDGAVTENEQTYQDYINSHPEMFTLETLAGDVQAMIDTVNTGANQIESNSDIKKSIITSPQNTSTFNSTTMTFRWNDTGASEYYLKIGTRKGASNLYSHSQGRSTTRTVKNLPTNGSKVYVRLYTRINGKWQYIDYSYRSYTKASDIKKSIITSPQNTSTFNSTTMTFRWNDTGASEYYLKIGTRKGASNLYSHSQGRSTTRTVKNLPTNGSKVYVRLYTRINGKWQYRDYSYKSYTKASDIKKSIITSPQNTSTFNSTTMTFRWNDTGASEYYLKIGTRKGTSNLYSHSQGRSTTRTVKNLPTNGSKVYVRLYTRINGKWQYIDYSYRSYTKASDIKKSIITSPQNTSTFNSTTMTFRWNDTGASEYYLKIGTRKGTSNLYSHSQGRSTTRTVKNLPTNGSKVYVRLYTRINGKWQYIDYSYKSTTKETNSTKIR